MLVEEAKRYTIAYGGGFEVQRLASSTDPTGSELQAAVRGILEISKLNVTGRGDSLSLKLRGSTIEDRALLTYTDPNTFANPHYTFQANVYTEKTQDINTFTRAALRRLGAIDGSGDAIHDAAVPLRVSKSGGIESEQHGGAGRNSAVRAAHAGLAIWRDLGARRARQSRGCDQGQL